MSPAVLVGSNLHIGTKCASEKGQDPSGQMQPVAVGSEPMKHIVMKAKRLCLGKSLLHLCDHLPNSAQAGLEMGIKQIKKILSPRTQGIP